MNIITAAYEIIVSIIIAKNLRCEHTCIDWLNWEISYLLLLEAITDTYIHGPSSVE